MEADHQSHVAFYLTGTRTGTALEAVDGLRLRPALFAAYRDLTRLRYDFPVVLARDGFETPYASLSEILDGALQKAAAPGCEDERLHKRVLQVEREIRRLVSTGTSGTLGALWDLAASRLGDAGDPPDAGLSQARAALAADGELLDCSASTPARLITHAWRAVQDEKARKFHEVVGRLVLRLNAILQADFAASAAGRSAQNLKASVGATYEDVFDFEAMSQMLAKSAPAHALSESRRNRIETLLSVLGSQRFFPPVTGAGEQAGAQAPYLFSFATCARAARAFRERLPGLIELAKAIAVAELEVKGEYSEVQHDRLFAAFGHNGFNPQDLAAFPDYLVCTRAPAAGDYAECMALLAANLPVKIAVQFDDILETSPLGDGHLAFGLRSKQLADMAIGLNQVYVLQSSASNLVQCRRKVLDALRYGGPALFSIYSGAAADGADCAPYLAAAAAMESRVFPAFAYDPSAGTDWASRFSVAQNPQADREWPVMPLEYEDLEHQVLSEDVDFTVIDFAACDPRHAHHFARVPPARWNGNLVSVREHLSRAVDGLPDKVPHILMVDENNALQRVIVDATLIQEARRCRAMWRSLQELGGIRNSHAERLLARERQSWDEMKQREMEALKRGPAPLAEPAVTPAAPVEAAADAMPAQPAAPAEARSDEAYIETPRCTSCDECIQLNNRMFTYDENKQARIADAGAGTYRQLVEAAESCQVSIIHPGKPRSPAEPGIEELVARAEPFL